MIRRPPTRNQLLELKQTYILLNKARRSWKRGRPLAINRNDRKGFKDVKVHSYKLYKDIFIIYTGSTRWRSVDIAFGG